jgi:hypothetical protein
LLSGKREIHSPRMLHHPLRLGQITKKSDSDKRGFTPKGPTKAGRLSTSERDEVKLVWLFFTLSLIKHEGSASPLSIPGLHLTIDERTFLAAKPKSLWNHSGSQTI